MTDPNQDPAREPDQPNTDPFRKVPAEVGAAAVALGPDGSAHTGPLPTGGFAAAPGPAQGSSGYGAQPTAQPQVQYFLPPGRPLPLRTWQRKSKGWVWGISVVAGIVFVAGAIIAITVGVLSGQTFTATGALQVDCATGQSLNDPRIIAGESVRIYDAKSGDLLAHSKLDRRVEAKGGTGACYATFVVEDVPAADSGTYLLEIGDSYSQLASRDALEGGVLLT
ncbi:MAG: hypothetical protein QM658_09950 [Gordonia sp. (in: high G+C Gram-positive bacteria)]